MRRTLANVPMWFVRSDGIRDLERRLLVARDRAAEEPYAAKQFYSQCRRRSNFCPFRRLRRTRWPVGRGADPGSPWPIGARAPIFVLPT